MVREGGYDNRMLLKGNTPLGNPHTKICNLRLGKLTHSRVNAETVEVETVKNCIRTGNENVI